jgi:ribosomal protein S27E
MVGDGDPSMVSTSFSTQVKHMMLDMPSHYQHNSSSFLGTHCNLMYDTTPLYSSSATHVHCYMVLLMVMDARDGCDIEIVRTTMKATSSYALVIGVVLMVILCCIGTDAAPRAAAASSRVSMGSRPASVGGGTTTTPTTTSGPSTSNHPLYLSPDLLVSLLMCLK